MESVLEKNTPEGFKHRSETMSQFFVYLWKVKVF